VQQNHTSVGLHTLCAQTPSGNTSADVLSSPNVKELLSDDKVSATKQLLAKCKSNSMMLGYNLKFIRIAYAEIKFRLAFFSASFKEPCFCTHKQGLGVRIE
jgi:hypothetical protein